MIRTLLALTLLLSLSACYAHNSGHHHGHHKGGGTSVRVEGVGEVHVNEYPGAPAHKCPPGHHMKGRC